jgi:hypothetical protein
MEFHRAEIGREVMTPVVFNEGQTISELLSKARITLSSDEGVRTFSGGNVVELNERAENDETYIIVKNYKNGN